MLSGMKTKHTLSLDKAQGRTAFQMQTQRSRGTASQDVSMIVSQCVTRRSYPHKIYRAIGINTRTHDYDLLRALRCSKKVLTSSVASSSGHLRRTNFLRDLTVSLFGTMRYGRLRVNLSSSLRQRQFTSQRSVDEDGSCGDVHEQVHSRNPRKPALCKP